MQSQGPRTMLSYGQEAPLTTRPSSRQHALSRYYIPGPPKQVSLLCTAQAGIGLLSLIQLSMQRLSNLNRPGPAAVTASIFRQKFPAQLQPDVMACEGLVVHGPGPSTPCSFAQAYSPKPAIPVMPRIHYPPEPALCRSLNGPRHQALGGRCVCQVVACSNA